MKKIFVVVLILSIGSSFLISCGENEESKIKELKQQVQIEKMAKEKAQKNAAEAKSSLNLLVGLSIAVVLISLNFSYNWCSYGFKSPKESKKTKC